jgi:hypothetical protein
MFTTSRAARRTPQERAAADAEQVRNRTRAAMSSEFDLWVSTLPTQKNHEASTVASTLYPPIHEPGGLPPGWRIRTHMDTFNGRRWNDTTYTTCLVSRAAGGWALMRHQSPPNGDGKALTLLDENRPTLGLLYAHICEQADLNGAVVPALRADEQMMREFIVAHYDLTVDDEAAEATLAALGGRHLVMPATLT